MTYWFRVREPLWHWLHERLLWRYALAALEGDAPFELVVAPANEAALLDVLHALGRRVETIGEPDPDPAAAAALVPRRPRCPTTTRSEPPCAASPAACDPDANRRPPPSAADGTRSSTSASRCWRASPRPRIVVLTLPGSYQRIGGAGGTSRDPNLGSVIPKLHEAGLEPIVVGIGMSRKRDEDWSAVESDDRLLPGYLLASRWGRPEDDDRAAAVTRAVIGGVDAMPPVALDLDGLDIRPAFVDRPAVLAGTAHRCRGPPARAGRAADRGAGAGRTADVAGGPPNAVADGRGSGGRADLRAPARDPLPDPPGLPRSPRPAADRAVAHVRLRRLRAARPGGGGVRPGRGDRLGVATARSRRERRATWRRVGRIRRRNARPSAASSVSPMATGCSSCRPSTRRSSVDRTWLT